MLFIQFKASCCAKILFLLIKLDTFDMLFKVRVVIEVCTGKNYDDKGGNPNRREEDNLKNEQRIFS